MARRHVMSGVCAAALLCGGDGALAQKIYKQTDAAGHTTFSDRPGANTIVPYTTLSGEVRSVLSPRHSATSTWSEVANALFTSAPMTSMYAAAIDFNEATRRLEQARENRRGGVELRAGEQADDPGTGVMNKRYERYQRRQQKLERAVMAAERRTHETSLARSAR